MASKSDLGGAMSNIVVRRGKAEDAPALGEICYRAFKAIADEHNYPPDFPDAERATGAIGMMIGHPGVFDVVAELGGRMVGSNFLDERSAITGIGPISVDPDVQNEGVGRVLMGAVMDRSAERGAAGVRLVQSAYHRRSLALYLKLGFEAREMLVCFQGDPIGQGVGGARVRAATPGDAAACNRLCFDAHGHDRAGELADAIAHGVAQVVERDGRITGYASQVAFFGHAVGESNDDLKALIGAATAFPGPGFLVPSRNSELVRWCLAHGLRINQAMTLMSIGLYAEPKGAWLPSVLY